VTYTQPGLYSVSLSATDGATTDSEVKTNYIRVLPTPSTIPYWEGFEGYSSLNNLVNWEVLNQENNNAFTIENTTGYSGSQCAKLVNFGQAPSNVDELISSPIDLSIIPQTGTVTLSFRYSYRKKTSADYEYLKVFITGNCGDSWVQRKSLGGNQLSSLTASSSWTPTSQADWVTVHMTNVTNSYFQDNFRAKFRFEGEGGNNFYLDDINLYAGAPSNTVVLGVNDEASFSNPVLYPNPANEEVHVSYHSQDVNDVNVSVLDLNGKVLQNYFIKSNSGQNMVMFDIQALAQGSYMVKLSSTKGQIILPFIKK
jgi:PKD repeat protein